jgi:SET domain-containing protein
MKQQNRDFVRVGRSRIEGKGVFAKRKIPASTRIIEYAGARLPLANLLVMADGARSSHIYAFRLNETTVIDGSRNGNESRFIDHSCTPNCEAYEFDNDIYIYAMNDIVRGNELTFDHGLGPPRPIRLARQGISQQHLPAVVVPRSAAGQCGV